MKKNTYLNGILTVIALLLAALLWVQVAERPLADAAVAEGPAVRIPNAAAQRRQIINGLADVQMAVKDVNRALKKGEFSVRVTNISEFPVAEGRRGR